MKVRMLVVLVVVAGLVVSGCGKKKQEAEQEAAARIVSKAMSMASGRDTKVEVDGDKVTFTDAEGGMTIHAGKGTELPKDFPSDILVYEAAEILHSASRGADGFSVSMQTQDALGKVVEFHKKAMEAQGWQSETAMDMPNRAMLVYKKGERMAHLMIASDSDGGTVISLTAATAK